MKTLILASLAIATLAGSAAVAADLPIRRAAPAAMSSCAQFGGGYIGANAGWAVHDHSWTDRDAWVDNFSFDWAVGSANTSRGGGTAGGQLGYNWQRGCVVFGIELDANWTDLSGSKSYTPTALPGPVLRLKQDVQWFGTARTRTGLVIDNVMLYATGGFAYASIKNRWSLTDSDPVPAVTESFSGSSDRWGGVAGVGVEWAWSDRITIKSEALYVRFSERTTRGFSTAGNQNVRFDTNDALWVSRIGINYRFGVEPAGASY